MENTIPVQINKFPQPPAEPSDNGASNSSGNGHKATQLIKASFTLLKDYDIIFSCILPVNKGILLQQSAFSFISSKDVLT